MKKNKVISDWLDKYGDTEIDKKVEMKLEEMNKEQIIDEVYKNYLSKINNGRIYPNSFTQEEFINKIKTDPEFSEKWGLQIEERELSLEERQELQTKMFNGLHYLHYSLNGEEGLHKEYDKQNVPTKLITITYNNETLKSYEN